MFSRRNGKRIESGKLGWNGNFMGFDRKKYNFFIPFFRVTKENKKDELTNLKRNARDE